MGNIDEKIKLLGLNEKQAATYSYILTHKSVTLKKLAAYLQVSIPRTSIITKELEEKNFIKKIPIDGTKVEYRAENISNLKNYYLEDYENKRREIESVFRDLNSAYGNYTIKVERLNTSIIISKVHKFLLKAKKAFEFMDMKILSKPNTKTPTELKNIDFKFIYNHPDPEFKHEIGHKIKLEPEKNYAFTLSFDDKIHFVTSNHESILITNQEIANTIQYLIDEKHKTSNK